MAFVNDYLTEEEIEKFRKLNISYGKMILKEDKDVVGTEPFNFGEGIRCTLDRENKMYLFYCGDDSWFGREEKWSPYFFVFIQEKQTETIVTRLGLEDKYPRDYPNDDKYQRIWRLFCINSIIYESNDKYDYRKLINALKAALKVYGVNGNPQRNITLNIAFEF